MPRPDGNLFTIRAVALLVGRSEGTIYNRLSEYADRFDAPMYDKINLGRGDHRHYRVLSEHDMQVIRQLFPLFVKRKKG